MTNDVLAMEAELHRAGKDMLARSGVLPLLETLGEVTVRGSYTTRLMTYPDMDFAVQNNKPNINDARKLMPIIFDEFHAYDLRFTDFSKNNDENASYFLGFKFTYKNLDWQIAATVGRPGPIRSDPPELDFWLGHMTAEQRISILRIKSDLKAAGRYVGARSMPPYTFRSVHVYESVLQGGAVSVQELEAYFTN